MIKKLTVLSLASVLLLGSAIPALAWNYSSDVDVDNHTMVIANSGGNLQIAAGVNYAGESGKKHSKLYQANYSEQHLSTGAVTTTVNNTTRVERNKKKDVDVDNHTMAIGNSGINAQVAVGVNIGHGPSKKGKVDQINENYQSLETGSVTTTVHNRTLVNVHKNL